MNTTLNKIRAHSPCQSGWTKLLKHLDKTEADDEPLSFKTILESNGLDDALWCTRSAPEYNKEWRLYAIWCARQVQHLMTDPRSIAALNVAEQHANGLASDVELATARDAAIDAAGMAANAAARDSANAAAMAAAWAAMGAAWAAARDSANAAAWDAARDAARCAALDAARDAARAAAWDAAREAQRLEFLRVIGG